MMTKAVVVDCGGKTADPMWEIERQKLLPWLFGKGVDVGCGARKIRDDVLGVDIDRKVKPDVVASGDSLPFPDGEFDFVCGIHSFEHFADADLVLCEWLRVLRPGGFIGIVHPDITFTKRQKGPAENKVLRDNRYYKHYHEHSLESFLSFLKKRLSLGFDIVDFGPACPNWSFYVILKKR